MSTTARTAWLRTERGVAIICGWCPDKDLADARALEEGLTLSHGICPECSARILAEQENVIPFFAPVNREISGGVSEEKR